MKLLRDLAGRELHWVQPKAMRRDFELRDGEDIVATLSFRSAFGSLATVEAAEGSWTLKRVGFWKTRVTVRAAGSDDEIAVFTNNTWSAGGTLETADHLTFRANTNFWMTSYQFSNEQDETLVRFTKVGGVFHLSSRVEIHPAGARLAALPWLVALGWYLAVKMHDDAAGGAAAAAAAG